MAVRKSTIVLGVAAVVGEAAVIAVSVIILALSGWKPALVAFGIGELLVIASVIGLGVRAVRAGRRAWQRAGSPTSTRRTT